MRHGRDDRSVRSPMVTLAPLVPIVRLPGNESFARKCQAAGKRIEMNCPCPSMHSGWRTWHL